MTPRMAAAIIFALLAFVPQMGNAALRVPLPWLPAARTLVQSDVPDVVMLLAQRALRAERRGDMETAQELYDTIRDLGYVVRRPSGSEAEGTTRRRGLFGGTGRQGEDDDRDDDRDDDGDDRNDEADGDDGGDDSDGGDESDGGDGGDD